MMEILAHRGMWKTSGEKNSISALCLALCSGFGVETDIRDYKGKLVISHDIPSEDAPELSTLLKIIRENNFKGTLALNIKSDGLQQLLQKEIQKYGLKNYFLFDMSVPEEVSYEKKGLCFYTRHSDVEETPVLYENATGVWMDSFFSGDWITEERMIRHLRFNKCIGVISPEIHGFDKVAVWKKLAILEQEYASMIKLCTDCPEEARLFFRL